MEPSSAQRHFHINAPLRQIETATHRFAQEVPAASGETLCAVLLGPSTAAKAQLARQIHNASSRAARPFIRIDCRHSAGIQFATFNGTMRSTRPIAGDGDPPRHFFHFATGGTLFFDHWDPVAECECERLFAELKSSRKTPLAAADPFSLDVAVTIAIDVSWTDGSDDECLLVHVPLAQLKEYVAYLATTAEAELLTAN